jgi:RNA-binding protein
MPPIKKPRSKAASNRPLRGAAARTGKPRTSAYGRAEPEAARPARDTAAPARTRTGKSRAGEYARGEPSRSRRDASATARGHADTLRAGKYRDNDSGNARQQRATSTPARERADRPRASEPVRAEPARPRPLTASQKRHLRGFTHDLKPVILVGQKGVTAALLAELAGALEHHELVKVKLADDDRESRAASIERIREHSGAEIVQAIGKTASFFKHNPDRNQYPLPK